MNKDEDFKNSVRIRVENGGYITPTLARISELPEKIFNRLYDVDASEYRVDQAIKAQNAGNDKIVEFIIERDMDEFKVLEKFNVDCYKFNQYQLSELARLYDSVNVPREIFNPNFSEYQLNFLVGEVNYCHPKTVFYFDPKWSLAQMDALREPILYENQNILSKITTKVSSYQITKISNELKESGGLSEFSKMILTYSMSTYESLDEFLLNFPVVGDLLQGLSSSQIKVVSNCVVHAFFPTSFLGKSYSEKSLDYLIKISEVIPELIPEIEPSTSISKLDHIAMNLTNYESATAKKRYLERLIEELNE